MREMLKEKYVRLRLAAGPEEAEAFISNIEMQAATLGRTRQR
jgi:hypothetical protein